MSDSPYHRVPEDPNFVPEHHLPSRARFRVLGLLCALSGILYLDRICISAAVESIKKDVGLNNTQVGYVLMAFTVAYGLFEVPTGRWGDVLGARRVLTRISLWWSVFTALTGACTGLWSLVAVRFLFGAGEAGAFPNAARVMSRWFPDQERGRAHGLFLAASQIGGAASPILAAWLIREIGWRVTFGVFGLAGAIWASVFWWWFRDDPAMHPAANAAEVRHIGQRSGDGTAHPPIPWGLVLRNPSVRALSLIMICGSFNSYIYFGWFPTYLQSGRDVDRMAAGWMTTLVLSMSAAGTLSGGWIMDRLILHGGNGRRRLMGGGFFFAAAASLIAALMSHNSWIAAGFTAMSCFATQATQPLWWSCTTGISGRHVGALLGLMNSVGVVGALSSSFLVGWIADQLGARGFTGRNQWDPIFYINTGVLLTACLLWSSFRFRTVEPVSSDAVIH